MRTLTSACLLLLFVPTATAVAQTPHVELPPEDDAPPSQGLPDEIGMRGLTDLRRQSGEGTTLGGYGELHFTREMPERGDAQSEVDLHRLVLFFAHRYSDRLSFYSELEVEHAFAAPDMPGEVEVEQAFIDYRLVDDALSLRAGVVLVPFGITNLWHEPPVFHGVERPRVENRIVPTTWREGGIGLVGEPAEGLRYEIYLVGGLQPLGFSAEKGLRGGRLGAAEARADAFAVAGRVEYEPLLGLVSGLSAYWSNAGPNADPDLDLTVTGIGWDASYRRAGLEAKALVAWFSISGTEELRTLTDEEGAPTGVDMGSALFGAYAEVAYDVMHASRSSHELLPFARWEMHDTAMRADDAFAAGDQSATDLVGGVTWRPHPAVALKADYLLRTPGEGDSTSFFELGVGWMF